MVTLIKKGLKMWNSPDFHSLSAQDTPHFPGVPVDGVDGADDGQEDDDEDGDQEDHGPVALEALREQLLKALSGGWNWKLS